MRPKPGSRLSLAKCRRRPPGHPDAASIRAVRTRGRNARSKNRRSWETGITPRAAGSCMSPRAVSVNPRVNDRPPPRYSEPRQALPGPPAGAGGGRCVAHDRAWADPRPRGRIGLGEIDRGEDDPAAPGADGRSRPVRGRGRLRAGDGAVARVAAPHADRVPGSLQLAQPADDRGANPARAARDPPARYGRADGTAGDSAAP